jgi:hypothetical protein
VENTSNQENHLVGERALIQQKILGLGMMMILCNPLKRVKNQRNGRDVMLSIQTRRKRKRFPKRRRKRRRRKRPLSPQINNELLMRL